MKGKYIFLLLAAAGTLSLAGCQKTGLSGNEAKGDGIIRFSASAKSAGTKTAYGAYDNNNPNAATWQSIDWIGTDQIRIYSDAAARQANENYYWADYGVTGITAGSASSKQSTATLTNLSPGYGSGNNGLYWGSAASANFYAIYPKPAADEGTGNAIHGTKGILSGNIPASQSLTTDGEPNMSYAYMTAAGSGVKPVTDNVNNVTLEFSPAFTALEVTLMSTTAHTLTGAQLESTSTALAGDFTVKYTAGTSGDFTKVFDCTEATTKSISITGLNASIGPNTPYTFTIFALPQELKDLKLVFDIQGAQSRQLALKKNGESVPFSACKKHRIYGLQMPDGNWALYLESEVEEWIEQAKNPKYGEADADGVIISAGSLYYISGNDPDHSSRTEVSLAADATSLMAYFSVYSPTNGKWRITMKGEDASKFTLASETATTEGHKSVSGANAYVEGDVEQRVFFTVTPNGAESGDSVELYFTVVVSTTEGEGEEAVTTTKEYSLHSEVTFSQLPLTVKMP